MASPSKTGSGWHEIVGRHDATCRKCRGRTLRGSRIWWDKDTGAIEHVACPPVVDLAPRAYEAPPVTPDRWKELCRQIQEASTGMSSLRMVLDEDRKAYEADGAAGIIRSIIARTRCSGGEAIEIARKWIDSLRKPVDEEQLQKANRALSESRRKASMVAGSAIERGQ